MSDTNYTNSAVVWVGNKMGIDWFIKGKMSSWIKISAASSMPHYVPTETLACGNLWGLSAVSSF